MSSGSLGTMRVVNFYTTALLRSRKVNNLLSVQLRRTICSLTRLGGFLQFAEFRSYAFIPSLELVRRTVRLHGLLRPQSVFSRRAFVASKPLRVEHRILLEEVNHKFLLFLCKVCVISWCHPPPTTRCVFISFLGSRFSFKLRGWVRSTNMLFLVERGIGGGGGGGVAGCYSSSAACAYAGRDTCTFLHFALFGGMIFFL